jgi:sigma-B regulation protein RsbU (phosphoserine phosphatase)
LLADREKKSLEVKAAVGYADTVFDLRIAVGNGITGWAAAHRRTLRVGNVQQDTRYIEGSPNTRSEMAIPLLYRSELLGILNFESEQLSAYAENDEELLGTLGGSLAAIIANARLLEQIRAQAERERFLFEISDKIRRTTDIQTILSTTASELTRAVGANSARIKLGPSQVDPKKKRAGNE